MKTQTHPSNTSPVLDRVICGVLDHARQALLLVVVLTLLAAINLGSLEQNPTPYFIDKSHPSRVLDTQAKTVFEHANIRAVIALVTDQETVINADSLSTLHALLDRLAVINFVEEAHLDTLRQLAFDEQSVKALDQILSDGLSVTDIADLSQFERRLMQENRPSDAAFVQELILYIAPIGKIDSLITVEDLTSDGDLLEVMPVMDGIPATPGDMRALQDRIMANPMLVDRLVSSEGKMANTTIELLWSADNAVLMQKFNRVLKAIVNDLDANDTLYIVGHPAMAAEISSAMEKDNQTFLPFVLIVISAVLFLSFRRAQAVVLPLVVATITIVWTLSMMAFSGVKINIVTTSLPVFLIAISVADSVHFLAHYYKQLKLGLDKYAAIRHTFHKLFSPLAMTTVTTSIGFMALTISEISAIQEFGTFLAIGVVFAFLFTVLALPALLVLQKATVKNARAPSSSFFHSVAIGLNRFLIKHAKVMCALWAIGTGLMLFATTYLSVNSSTVEAFDARSEFRQSHAAYLNHFKGVFEINLWFSAEDERTFTDPAVVLALEDISNYIEREHSGSRTTFSIVDFIKRANQVVLGSEFELPDNLTQEQISQLLIFFESGERQDLFGVTDLGYKNARIQVFSNTDESNYWRHFVSDVAEYAERTLPDTVKLELYGFGEEMVSNVLEVIKGQVVSILVAALCVVVLLTLLFRSFVIGVLASMPLLITLIANFAIMAVFNVPLDIGTSIVASIAIGIGIDYAIHYKAALKDELANLSTQQVGEEPKVTVNGGVDSAFDNAFNAVYQPITVNSVCLGLGFLVLSISNYGSLASLGIIIASTMIICAVVTLLLLPSVFYLVNHRYGKLQP